MAISENKKYAIISIQNDWSNFRIEHLGKDITIFGYDGETTNQWAGVFGDKLTEPVYEEVVLTGVEQHWSDLAVWSILDEASDENGKRYLILVREGIFKNYKLLWDNATRTIKTAFMKEADKEVPLDSLYDDFTTEFENEWKEFVDENSKLFK